MELITFLVLAVTVLCTLYYVKREIHFRKKYSAFFGLSTPFYFPLVGNTYIFLKNDILQAITKIINSCGKQCVAYFPGRSYITSSPEELKIILNHQDCLEKHSLYINIRDLMRNSLLLSDVSTWKKNRKILSKGFKQNILDSFVSTFYEKSCTLVNVINEHGAGDIYELFEKFTLETFCEATFGIESTIMTDIDSYFVKCVTMVQRIMMGRITSLTKRYDFLFKLHKEKKSLDDIVNYMYKYIQQIIDVKSLRQKDVLADPNRLPVLDILLEQKDKLDTEYIKEEMVLFASAATDTTAYSLSYICCLLAMHPKVQDKVRDEVLNVIGQDREITKENFTELKYTEMAINESLRLIPVVPFIGRYTTNDIDLGNKIIPKGTDIVVNIFSLHRDGNLYENPLRYDPDRFLAEEIQLRPPYSFIPFSAGPRNCIGWKYSMMLMKTAIANVVRNFTLTTKYKTVDELSFTTNIVMSTTHPLDVQFTARN